METGAVAIVALLVVLFLGGASVALAVILLSGHRAISKRKGLDHSLEADAERLHRMVHPDEDAANE